MHRVHDPVRVLVVLVRRQNRVLFGQQPTHIHPPLLLQLIVNAHVVLHSSVHLVGGLLRRQEPIAVLVPRLLVRLLILDNELVPQFPLVDVLFVLLLLVLVLVLVEPLHHLFDVVDDGLERFLPLDDLLVPDQLMPADVRTVLLHLPHPTGVHLFFVRVHVDALHVLVVLGRLLRVRVRRLLVVLLR